VGLGVLVALGAALVVLEALGVLAALVVLAVEIARPLCRLGPAISGSTIRNTEAVPHTKTEQPQTALAERRVVIPFPSVKRAPGNKLAGRVATSPAPAAEPVSAIARAAVVSATGVEPA
jgi:hypothetical protein